MAYDSVLDSQIHAQLLEVEDDLLDISIVDRPTLASFVARLAHLTEETTRCLKGGYLSPKTIHLARNVALGGKLIADKLVQIHRVTQDVEQKRESDIADVFARMSLNEKTCTSTVSSGSESLSLANASRKPGEKDASVPSYISNACEWLKNHYHNPYPTAQEKKKILGNADASIKAVDSWFKGARKRIGWSALANRFFRNRRSELVYCAFRVFIKPNPALPVKQEITQHFKQMEANVKKLYYKDLQVRYDAPPVLTQISSRQKADFAETENEASLRNTSNAITIISSSAPSLVACPSESGVSSSLELTTPAPSPSQAKLPLERLDGWIGDLRAEATFLPHDLSDKPQSVLSVKRASSDSAPDAPPKRARVEKGPISYNMHESEKPEYKARSCEWLLANLHNPYPTHAVKAKIASEAAVPVKTVEDWFTYTRQQIGWTSLMKTFFRSCRAEAVDCAMSVLAGEPTRRPILDGPREALLAMRSFAISLLESRQDVSETMKKIEADFKNRFSSAVVDDESRSKDVKRNGASKARRVRMNQSFNASDDNVKSGRAGQEQPNHITKSERKPRSTCSSEEEAFTLLSSHIEPVHPDTSQCSSRKRCLSSSEPDEEPARKRHQISSGAYSCSDNLVPSYVSDIFGEGFNSALGGLDSLGILDQTHIDMDNLFSHPPHSGPNAMTGADGNLTSDIYSISDRLAPPNTLGISNHGYHATADNVEALGTLDQSYFDWDSILNFVSFGEPNSMTGAETDPLAMLVPEDFGEDFSSFPTIPEFSADGTEICPPSFEFFPVPSNGLLPMSVPGRSDVLDDLNSLCLSSTSTLVDSPPIHSLSFNKSHSVDAYSSSCNIFDLACNIAPSPHQLPGLLQPKDT